MTARRRIALLASLAAVAGLAFVAVNLAGARARPTCFGRTPSKPAFLGNNRDNTITGTKHSDVIIGMGGDDTIDGRGGADLICGDGGDEDTDPNGGNDKLIGGAGDDKMDGQGGVDVLKGEGGEDRLSSGFDARGVTDQADVQDQDFNRLIGGAAKDKLFGDQGNDVLVGDAGPDIIKGDKAGDRIDGGGGADTIDGDSESATGAGDDFIDAGPGRDTVLGGDKNDVILGGDESGPGDKRLDGGDGSDEIRGDRGDDNLIGGLGGDDLDGGPGTDQCDPGDEPNDLVPKNCENGPPDACSDSKHTYTVTIDTPENEFVPTPSPQSVQVCKNEDVRFVNNLHTSVNVIQDSGPSNFQFPFGMATVDCNQGGGGDPTCNQTLIVFGDKGVIGYHVETAGGSPGPASDVVVRTR